MKKLVVLGCVLMLVTTAHALGPKPYVGLSLQANSPTGDFSKDDLEKLEGGAKTGAGLEFDVGLTGKRASAYIGYRWGKHDANAAIDIPGFGTVDADGEWEINRVVIGGRWHIFGGLPTPLFPTFGGGVTIGKTSAEISETVSGVGEVGLEKDSETSVGWFIEGGGMLRIGSTLSALANIQYHNFDATFDTGVVDGTLNISFFTLNVGLRLAVM